MAEIGAGNGIVVKGGGGPGTGGGTIYLLRQTGLSDIGPVSIGGEVQSLTVQNTGTSPNQTSIAFDGIKGAYNANISQQYINSIVYNPPGGSTILPYVLYGMSNYTPSPLTAGISLHQFLDEKIGKGGIQTTMSDRRSTGVGIGGFISVGYGQGASPQPLLQQAGPSSISEIMNAVPHDPFIDIDGNQSGTGKGSTSIGVIMGMVDIVLPGSNINIKGSG